MNQNENTPAPAKTAPKDEEADSKRVPTPVQESFSSPT